jgi:hypothetical protein
MLEQETRRAGEPVIPAADADPESRPGVPMEAPPEPAAGAHWMEPERQTGIDGHLHHTGIDRPTPVVGTAQRPHGVSGWLRTRAYDIPEHYGRRWMLLLFADRVDVVEGRLGDMLARPLEQAGLHNGAGRVRSNPLGVVAGAAVGVWMAKRMLS